MTTFVTSCGPYRYTRLMFGVTSAPEKCQQIIPDVLGGCEGVIDIAQFVSKLIPDLSTVAEPYPETNSQECGVQMAVGTTGCI